MLAKRIIPCLDVINDKVVKGIQFRNHRVIGDIIPLAEKYSEDGADELVFYEISASAENKVVDKKWVKEIAKAISIPFTVSGGIRNLDQARAILNSGADKISINSPALENPELISLLSQEFGKQCVVIGIDSLMLQGDYFVYQYTGSQDKSRNSKRKTRDWILEVEARGAGEIVLNCMNQDGVRQGYDLDQLRAFQDMTTLPLIASGGAGEKLHFLEAFSSTKVSGCLAASIFHDNCLSISSLKAYLNQMNIEVRL